MTATAPTLENLMTYAPPDPASPYGRIMSVLVANPSAWLTQGQVYDLVKLAYPEAQQQSFGNMQRLMKNGYVERRGQKFRYEYHWTGRTPPISASKHRNPLQIAAALARKDDGGQERQDRLEKTRRVKQQDWKDITAAMTGNGQMLEADIQQITGLPTGRLRFSLKGMADMGVVTTTTAKGGGLPPLYKLLEPSLPRVKTPSMTPEARRLLDHLSTRPADSELGMAAAFGWTRQQVCLHLAHLHALEHLAWGGVGHLILWRAA